jgi:CheY-like chemotaxis protein
MLLEKVKSRDTAVPTLVLTDIHMPDMNGIELTIELRKTSDHVALPIVGVTADHTSQLHHECMGCGMQAVITKPVSCSQLSATLTSVMQYAWNEVPDHFFKRNTAH